MKTSLELLEEFLNSFALIYGTTVSQDEANIWKQIFAGTRPAILQPATKALLAKSLKRPVPGALTAEIAHLKETAPPNFQDGTRSCSCEECQGLGYRLVPLTVQEGDQYRHYRHAEKCPCHPKHAEAKSVGPPTYDKNGAPCRVDPRTGEFLYAAVDCEPGRRAMLAFARLAGKSFAEQETLWRKWEDLADSHKAPWARKKPQELPGAAG